jgi:hypothetical protein
MAHSFTREQLFGLVWSEPTRTVATRLGMSDVGLAKACRRADLVMPPRGYWAKLAAGKRVSRAVLPPRGPGMSDLIVLGQDHWSWADTSVTPNTPVPPLPTFSESLDELGQRMRLEIGAVRQTRDLAKAHPRIQKLLAADEKRRAKLREWPGSTWNSPLFDSPFAQRRLRLLNSLMRALDKVAVTVSVEGKEGASLNAIVGSVSVSFAIDAAGKKFKSNHVSERPGPMRCYLTSHSDGTEVVRSWADAGKNRVEHHLADIAVAILVEGERRYRANVHRYREWVIRRKVELAEESRKREEERQRLERKRIASLEKARIGRLLTQAHALRQANEIRHYAAAVREIQPQLERPLGKADLRSWIAWALEQADRIDPIVSGLFRTVQDDTVMPGE